MLYEKEDDFQGEQRRTRRVHSLGRSSPHDNPNPKEASVGFGQGRARPIGA